MTTGDLTTLAKVKQWLSTGPTLMSGDEALLSRLITAASSFVQNYLNRTLTPADYTETYNGFGQLALFLRNSPIISVASLKVDGVAVQPNNNPPLGSGYMFDVNQLYVMGSAFTRGFQNITVQYAAGFQISNEAQVIPANGILRVDALAKSWNTDRGVTGYTLSSAAPALGQYQLVAQSDATMAYVFNVGNAAAQVAISYGWTPDPVEQAVIELVGERYKKRTNIGMNSLNIGNGQVVSYSNKDMNDHTKTALNNFVNVVPVQ